MPPMQAQTWEPVDANLAAEIKQRAKQHQQEQQIQRRRNRGLPALQPGAMVRPQISVFCRVDMLVVKDDGPINNPGRTVVLKHPERAFEVKVRRDRINVAG